METIVRAIVSQHSRISVTSERAVEFIDITDRIAAVAARSGILAGIVNVQTMHTTTAILINEHEPLLLGDFASMLDVLAPRHVPYRHDDLDARTVNLVPGERQNGHAHCQALLLGPAVSLNYADRRLQLGRWQRVFMAELDGPRDREVSVLVLGEGAR